MDVAEAESRVRRYIKKKYSNRKIKVLIKRCLEDMTAGW